MKAVDVFTPNKIPTVTFVHDHLVDRETLFKDTREKGGALIAISGPSKSGKTAFVTTLLGAENVIPVTGAGVKDVEDLWTQVFHQIGTPVGEVDAVTQTSTDGWSANGTVGGGVIVAKAEVSAQVSGGGSSTTSKSTTKATNLFQLLVKEVAGSGYTLFIDDFHYIEKAIQEDVAKQIKDAIAKDVNIICASVPYRSEDVLRANNELQGRIVSIDFSYWNVDALSKIAVSGFEALNIDVSSDMIRCFAEESAGSPQLMQSLCLDACFASGFRERQAIRATMVDSDELRKTVCTRTAASTDYSSTTERMRGGPRIRGQARNSYTLADNTVADVYVILMRALALAPPTLHFQYVELQKRIAQVCKEDAPSGSSVTTACSQLATIANVGQPKDLLEWNADSDVLDIREPLLLFYLRWAGGA